MKSFNKIIDTCINILSAIAAFALGFLLLGICYSTFSRFFFNKPLTNLVEYSSYSLIYITFFGSPKILRNRGHISLDILTNALSKKSNLRLGMFVNVLGAVLSAIITYFGGKVAIDNFVNNIRVMDSMGTPQYLLTMVIPIGMFFMMIQFFRNSVEDYRNLKS
ncbi:MAG: TRAP transporter small permease [Tindallia sp. MSAO_Bac2]|nr:MAG: TRAP transporter small permease [Tindallia sp. MSAO_Bac2]